MCYQVINLWCVDSFIFYESIFYCMQNIYIVGQKLMCMIIVMFNQCFYFLVDDMCSFIGYMFCFCYVMVEEYFIFFFCVQQWI